MQILPQGQFIKHVQYGLGVVTQSDAERTSIDFHLHGVRKFVTRLMTVELTDEAPPPKPRPLRRKKASTQTAVTMPMIGKRVRSSGTSGEKS